MTQIPTSRQLPSSRNFVNNLQEKFSLLETKHVLIVLVNCTDQGSEGKYLESVSRMYSEHIFRQLQDDSEAV